MRWIKWTGLAAAIVLIISCFMPWVIIDWRHFTATGIDAGPAFQSPGYGHFVFAFFFICFTLIQRIWAKRFNLVIIALNMGWAIRNFTKLSACDGGQCPDKQMGIYLMLSASVIMLLTALFPDMKVKDKDDRV
ncbi:MAG: hypothetical protein WDO71_12575 [Bacteroidota bacterium]